MRFPVTTILPALLLTALFANSSIMYQQRHAYKNSLSGRDTADLGTNEPGPPMRKPYKRTTNLPVSNHTLTATPTTSATTTITHTVQTAIQEDLADPAISAAALVGITDWIPGNYGKILGPVVAHSLSDVYNRLENVPGVYRTGDKIKNFGISEYDGAKEYFHRHAASPNANPRASEPVSYIPKAPSTEQR